MSTLPSNFSYDNFQPKLEMKEIPESHVLLIHLPGFAREQIGAKLEFDYRRVRVFGERPFVDDKSIRFNIAYPVPGNCDVSKLKGKFQGGIYSVIMPKKVISRGFPKELKPTEQEASKSPMHKTEQNPEIAVFEQERATAAEVKAEKVPKQAEETLTAPKATNDSMPQKGQEGFPQKLTFTRDTKHQTEEKIAGTSAENGEKQRVNTKEYSGKTYAQGKPSHQKGVMDDQDTEMESKKATIESEIVKKSFIPITEESKKGKCKEKEMDSIFIETQEGIHIKDINKSKGKRIKEVAASASLAVTSLLKRFNEEDKQMLIYTSATVLAVALSVYASYKFRSSARP